MEVTDCPREGALTLSEPYQGQGPSGLTFAFPPSLRSDSADDIQGNVLCARLGRFHFSSQYGGHGHGSVDEPVNVPTAIIENSYVCQSIAPEPFHLRLRWQLPGLTSRHTLPRTGSWIHVPMYEWRWCHPRGREDGAFLTPL